MKNKKVPLRTCVITHEKLPKNELIRIVRSTDGIIIMDTSGKINGRGAYIKKDISIIEKARKSKILNRVLKVDIPDNLYDELRENIQN